ncbi:hypothetical protein TcCL_NonESM09656 [Trypanosoma cruzi]|nr:hypothetical protein TcCL_NonESM09656 [Trypanosoma cruzi]
MESVVVSLKRAPCVNATGKHGWRWQESLPERHWSAGFPEWVARRGGDGSQGLPRALLLNAVVVVDGKSLMGEREIVCCRVISLGGTRWSDACVFALRMWCFGSLFHAIRWRRSGRGSDAITSCTGVVETVTRACGGPKQIKVYYAVWVHREETVGG